MWRRALGHWSDAKSEVAEPGCWKQLIRVRRKAVPRVHQSSLVKSQLLYQLSYAGAPHIVFGESSAACRRRPWRTTGVVVKLLSNRRCRPGCLWLRQETPFRSAWPLGGPAIQQPDIRLRRDAAPSVVVGIPMVPVKGSRAPITSRLQFSPTWMPAMRPRLRFSFMSFLQYRPSGDRTPPIECGLPESLPRGSHRRARSSSGAVHTCRSRRSWDGCFR